MNRPFRRQTPTSELSPAESVEKIVASLDRSGLDKRTTLILGGSGLAIAGVRPANDVDIMVPGAVFEGLYSSEKTPGGIHLQRKVKSNGVKQFLETAPHKLPTDMMPMDITRPFSPMPASELEKAFLERLRSLDTIGGYPYLNLAGIVQHKKTLGRPKDRRDIRLVERHLDVQKRKSA